MASQPSVVIPQAWGATREDLVTIPDTASSSGVASWAAGFPTECGLPLSQGGVPPRYVDFNSILNVLSQFALFQQSGGTFAWSATLDYTVGSLVLGSDNNVYKAIGTSGPSTTAVNPVGDTSGKWTRTVSATEIDAISQTANAALSAANTAQAQATANSQAITTLDANVVHKTGAETVAGAKTYTAKITSTFSSNGSFIAHSFPDVTKGTYPSTQRNSILDLLIDKDGLRLSSMESLLRINGNIVTRMYAFNNSANNSNVFLEVESFPDGSGTAHAPATLANNNVNATATDIVTRGFLTNNFVALSGDQSVEGVKTFTESLHIEKTYQPTIIGKATNYTRNGTTPSTAMYTGIWLRDSADTRCGMINIQYSTSGNAFIDFSVDPVKTTLSSLQVRLYSNNAGTIMAFRPETTNFLTLGNSGNVWKELFAATTTISTSDERVKTSIDDIPESVLDAWAEIDWCQFQFKDSITEKGVDKARIHNGLVAQRIRRVFQAHGLDISRYGLFCYDRWDAEPAEYDEQGRIITKAREAGDAYALRYEEALAMEAAYQRRRAARVEERLSRMETLLAEITAPLADATETPAE